MDLSSAVNQPVQMDPSGQMFKDADVCVKLST